MRYLSRLLWATLPIHSYFLEIQNASDTTGIFLLTLNLVKALTLRICFAWFFPKYFQRTASKSTNNRSLKMTWVIPIPGSPKMLGGNIRMSRSLLITRNVTLHCHLSQNHLSLGMDLRTEIWISSCNSCGTLQAPEMARSIETIQSLYIPDTQQTAKPSLPHGMA